MRIGRSALLVCTALAVGVSAAPDLKLDLNSPFFEELRSRPVPDDVELILSYHLFQRSGHLSTPFGLSDYADRRRIKALLGEEVPQVATIRDVILYERSPPEGIFALRRRALDALLAVERAPESKGNEVVYDGPVTYLGNSVWEGGRSGLLLWMRVKVTSRSPRTIDKFHIALAYPDRRRGDLHFWRCDLEGGGSLAPRETRFAQCLENSSEVKHADMVRAISADVLERPLRVTAIEMGEMRVVETNDTFTSPDLTPSSSRRAGEIIAATPCERLNACAQRAQRKAEEDDYAYKQTPAYREKVRLEEARSRNGKLTFGIALTAFLVVGLGALGGRWTPLSKSWGASVVTGLVALAGALTMAIALVFLSGYSFGEHGGLAALALLGIGGYILLALGGLAFILGVTLIDGAHRTRPRMATIGFAIGCAATFMSLFSH